MCEVGESFAAGAQHPDLLLAKAARES